MHSAGCAQWRRVGGPLGEPDAMFHVKRSSDGCFIGSHMKYIRVIMALDLGSTEVNVPRETAQQIDGELITHHFRVVGWSQRCRGRTVDCP